ncbi:MAG: hypothetical protein GY775_16720 [Candidatus Scalindua sp.]|nr:hypothetical protein [Candidatus Scalindua sp.]
MSNKTLETLRAIDSQLIAIRKYLFTRDPATGLSLDLFEGGDKLIQGDINFSVITGLEDELLDLILKSLERREAYYTNELKKEYNIIGEYLKEDLDET